MWTYRGQAHRRADYLAVDGSRRPAHPRAGPAFRAAQGSFRGRQPVKVRSKVDIDSHAIRRPVKGGGDFRHLDLQTHQAEDQEFPGHSRTIRAAWPTLPAAGPLPSPRSWATASGGNSRWSCRAGEFRRGCVTRAAGPRTWRSGCHRRWPTRTRQKFRNNAGMDAGI